jgi:hypothetical protein
MLETRPTHGQAPANALSRDGAQRVLDVCTEVLNGTFRTFGGGIRRVAAKPHPTILMLSPNGRRLTAVDGPRIRTGIA